jgi:hypothetical protein
MNGAEQRITIVDLRIPFFRLVFFFVKAALAMIPAAIILTLIWVVIVGVIYAIFGAAYFDFWTRRFSM